MVDILNLLSETTPWLFNVQIAKICKSLIVEVNQD